MTKSTAPNLSAMIDDMTDNLKFYPRDVISGIANEPGDQFTAMFMGYRRRFQVTENHGYCWFAKLLN